MTMATRNHQLMRELEQLLHPGAVWQDSAVCAQIGGDIWHPERGTSMKEAKGICADCPVRRQCLQHAIDHDERFGIWGGLSERERRRLKAADQTPSDTGLCGTSQGYQRHRYRNEQACAECRAATRLRSRDSRALKPPTIDVSCGTEAGGKAHGRRGERSCRSCKHAATSARRQRKATA